MAETVWEYRLPLGNIKFDVWMLEGAKILTLQVQGNMPVIWALVDSDRDKERRLFHMVGTGQDLPVPSEMLAYVGTFQDGGYVWHLFEEVN